MSAPVHARVAAVRALADGLTTYQRAFEAAIASARSDLARAQAELQASTALSQTAFDRAAREEQARRAELDRSERGPDRDGLAQVHARAVVARDEAARRWERHKQALAKVERAGADLLSTLRAVEASSSQAIPRGRAHVQKYAAILEQYLARGAA
jgi:hypothetical protein